jgi:hypothetical protein
MHLSKRAWFVVIVVALLMLAAPAVALADNTVYTKSDTCSQGGHTLTVKLHFVRWTDPQGNAELSNYWYTAQFDSGQADVTIKMYSRQVFLGGPTFHVNTTSWTMFPASCYWTPCYAGHNSTHVTWAGGADHQILVDVQ